MPSASLIHAAGRIGLRAADWPGPARLRRSFPIRLDVFTARPHAELQPVAFDVLGFGANDVAPNVGQGHSAQKVCISRRAAATLRRTLSAGLDRLVVSPYSSEREARLVHDGPASNRSRAVHHDLRAVRSGSDFSPGYSFFTSNLILLNCSFVGVASARYSRGTMRSPQKKF